MKINKEKIYNHWGFKIGKVILTSAPFALLLSIAFFWYEMYENDKETDKMLSEMKTIEQSLSTRHIGIFPDYLDEINLLLSETPLNDTSKIIIFEDVLFYGAFYNGNAFKDMILQLSKLANDGKKIVIAYYNNDKEFRRGRMFREVVQESWMRQSDLALLSQERVNILQDTVYKGMRNRFSVADSIVSEKYFALYRDNERKEFLDRREKILVPFYDAAKNDNLLFQRLDNLKNTCFNKPEATITFYDIYTMYYQFTEELKLFFFQHNIRTLPLNNYLTMSCWSNGEKVLFALPGRFAADEIGFISHDNAILNYIEAMLNGALVNRQDNE
jgi:hypothetical protein